MTKNEVLSVSAIAADILTLTVRLSVPIEDARPAIAAKLRQFRGEFKKDETYLEHAQIRADLESCRQALAAARAIVGEEKNAGDLAVVGPGAAREPAVLTVHPKIRRAIEQGGDVASAEVEVASAAANKKRYEGRLVVLESLFERRRETMRSAFRSALTSFLAREGKVAAEILTKMLESISLTNDLAATLSAVGTASVAAQLLQPGNRLQLAPDADP